MFGPRHWLQSLANSQCRVDPMEARDLVYYASSSPEEVVGVREFTIGEALRGGEKELELLSNAMIPSQWGPMHVFDLCVSFGHFETARVMAQRGVKNCMLLETHLERNSWGPNASCYRCRDDCSQTCDECCFGFPVEQGRWMKDWNVDLEDAIPAAQQTAKKPVVRFILDALSSGCPLPFAISEEAMAHLLDLAILTGDKEAAVCCAKQSKLRPLRRWSSGSFFRACPIHARMCALNETESIHLDSLYHALKEEEVLVAALSAGVDLEGLFFEADMNYHRPLALRLSLPEAVAVSASSWSTFDKLLPKPETPWVTSQTNGLGSLLFKLAPERDNNIANLCEDRLKNVRMAGLCLQDVNVQYKSSFGTGSLSLVDLAILTKQADCAALCAAMGAKLSKNGYSMLRHYQMDLARRKAAAAADLQICWRSQIVSKCIAVYQLMSMGNRRFPSWLVDQVIYLSLEPHLVQEFGLWDEAHAWCASRDWNQCLLSTPAPHAEEMPEEDPEEPTSPEPPPEPDPVPEKASNDSRLMRAVMESRNDMPLLNRDLCVFRLTRMANADFVVQLLTDPGGPLKALHDRVREAGCSISIIFQM